MAEQLTTNAANPWVTMMLIAGLVLSGCTPSGSQTEETEVPSRAEYAGAFEGFKSCVERAGGAVEALEVAADTGLITYRARPPEVGGEAVLDECHRSEFLDIEVEYTRSVQPADGSLTQADREFFASTILPCLEVNDEPRSMPETYGGPDYQEAVEIFNDLALRGLCPGVQAEREGE